MSDFSSIGGAPAHTGKIDFSAVGGTPMVGGDEPTDDTTALGAAGRGAVSMIPMGNQAYSAIAGATENEPYLQERQELEKETQSDQANHPIARVAGQAAGVIAPAVATAGASAPESLLGAVGEGAAVGAGFGAGNAVDTLASGGSGAKAAGDVALGAGLGAAGGAAGRALGNVLGKASSGLEKTGVTKGAEAMGLGPTELGNMTEPKFAAFQQFVKEQGLLGKTPQEMLDKANAVQTTFGDKIGEIRDQAHALGLTTDIKPLTDALDEKYQAASALQNPDERIAARSYKSGIADILTMAAQNPTAEGEVPTQITFDQLQRLKKSYGNSAFENGAVKNPAAADVYGTLKGGLQKIVDDAQTDPNLGQDYKDALKGYTQISPIVEGLEQRVGVARSGGGGGNVASNLAQAGMMASMGRGSFAARQAARAGFALAPETVARGANAIAGGVGAVGNALPGAGAQIGGATAPSAQNMGEAKPINSQGSSPASGPTNPGATSLNVDHPALAPWKQTFQKNAQSAKDAGEVQKANAVTDFVLSQRDPAYAAAKQKMNDNPTPAEPTPAPTKMAEGGVVEKPAYTAGSKAPMNPLADKLKAYLMSQKEKANGGH
jgi:hypothetical protein